MLVDELFKFYENKKVLVAGASGLTGRNLVDYLEYLCCGKVVGTCFSKTDSNFTQVDFTDPQQTKDLFDSDSFDYVFICCAKTYNAQVCKDNPESLILPNLNMVSNILENCKRTGVKKVLYVSSATVYQEMEGDIKESDLDLNKNPRDIYMGIGWAKRYMEKLCEFYSKLGLSTVVVRPTNIYGAHDKTDADKCHAVPSFIMRGLRKDDPFIVNSRGDGIKNFIYVDDFVRDLAKAMTCGAHHIVFNLCSDHTHSIREIVEMLVSLFDYKPEVIFKDNPDYVKYLNLDRSKFDFWFGKDTYVDTKKGLNNTLIWYSLLPQTQRKLITI